MTLLYVAESTTWPASLVPLMYEPAQRKLVAVGSNMAYTEVSFAHPPELLAVVTWAKQKMLEESEINHLVQSNPAIRDAKTALDVLLALNKSS